jgi:TonB family protein
MSVLFNDARFNTRPRPPARSRTGLWLSVVAHVTFAVVLTAVVPTRASENASASRPRSIAVFRMPVAELAPVKLIPVVAPRLFVPPVAPRPVQRAAIADVPKPVPVAPIAAKPVEPAPVALLPAAAPAFERPVEKAPERPPETGLFERTSAARASQSLPTVMTAGFGSVPSSAPSEPSGAITTGGFGRTAASTRSAASGGEDVRTSGFDRRPSAPAQPASAVAPVRVDRPVEIVFKPSPEYTDEARSARIEGTVTLELEFTAAGEVRVLRVVRGLGHGLDEAAERAALKIRFKPAQSSDGRAVDSRATVHITFRLS